MTAQLLATDATDAQMAQLRDALAWMVEVSPVAFDALFAPSRPRRSMPMPPDPVARPLLAFHLVERGGHGVRGLRRVLRRADRFYVLDIGLGDDLEYRQDTWPETDTLLAILEAAAPGRLCDLGCGTGQLAIEGRVRGHQVVATDLYQSALQLARFNARLNRVEGIDFRLGDLYAPLAGERFDLILTTPHYGGVDDQLRCDVLRGAPEHLAPRGRLILATQLEWEEPGRLGIESVLRPLVDRGLAVTVTPIYSDYKRDWFATARTEEAVPFVVSHHRFAVEIAATGAAKLTTTWPREDDVYTETLVPVSRLTHGRVRGVVTTPTDVVWLGRLLTMLAQDSCVFDEPLPMGLVDLCRWGARPCVAERGAAAAIVDVKGRVRPCSQGEPIGRAEESLATLKDHLLALDVAARSRRGCVTCPAEPRCAKCLFPFPLDETAFCDFMRMNYERLPLFYRLLDTVQQLDEAGIPDGPLTIHRLQQTPPGWPMARTWTVERAARFFLFWSESGILRSVEVEATAVRALHRHQLQTPSS